MNNILVPLGTSSDANKTLKYAVDFALDFGANIYIMDVFTVTSGTGNLGNVLQKVAKSSRDNIKEIVAKIDTCLLYTSPSPRDQRGSRMPSSA